MTMDNLIKNRIIWIDVVKYICIMCVICSHTESCTNFFSCFFRPFFLTGFFFVAGYVYTHNDNFIKFFYKKIRGLFIPWLVFGLFLIFIPYLYNLHSDATTGLKKFKLIKMFLAVRGFDDVLWFILALFISFIPFYFFIKLYERKKAKKLYLLFSFILSLISVIYSELMPTDIFPWHSNALPWHIQFIFPIMFFLFLGYCFKGNWEEKFDKYNTSKNQIIIVILYLLLRYIPYFMGMLQGQYCTPIFNLPLSIIYTYISQLLGLVMLLSISKSIKTNIYISYVGQNTLLYYIFHGKIFSPIQEFVFQRHFSTLYSAILANTMYSTIFCILFVILVSILLIVYSEIVNRYFPYLIGRSFRKKY